ncbi:peptide-methionine (S)-S-oxide reductase MsrA [Bacillus carboniphilus]|uniref:Peptide methionine sulfoxide reductase MsrA n=1 Tax=Bacillus carboniphilus TaxID=86663 RepID=A0ABY9JXW7_9BACI|nr:peptide-methionine (S)-S-oxide reductase MsrA [Bacillus carboniphilus]WLR43367.1 peptide-methionine (S)-S-oxide reductase MsrA [Bacillus carboniphilus]
MNQFKLATFAGGCFWCMVQPFDQLPGIKGVVSGYMGGSLVNPTYEQVKTGQTGHYEVVQIAYDPSLFKYEKLLELYWIQIDPTDDGGQFHDRGSQYLTAIFFHDEKQRILAERSKEQVSLKFTKPIQTKIIEASTFYEAEEEHQQFYKKNPKGYKEDRKKSGRDKFIKNQWQ